ncbi:MAG TPA: M12 family metallo-peptidase [Candidatus Krumholzibacteria bacterium]|nr:M12 family metallo-peptidase [Candidatus Krumholzibacteria bacterium]
MKLLPTLLLGGLLLAAAAALGADASSAPPSPFRDQAPGVTTAAPDPLWTDLGDELTAGLAPGARETMPRKYRALRLDYQGLADRLAMAPHEKDVAAADGLEITLPMPDGTFQRFLVVESPMLAGEAAAQMPDFRTYAAQGLDDPTATLRLDTSPLGFHAYGRTALGVLWIDPYQRGETSLYLSAWRHDFDAPVDGFGCGVIDGPELPEIDGLAAVPSSGNTLYTYRMVLTLTGEYTTYFGGASLAQAFATITLNRVNSIYEADVCVRFILTAFQTYTNPISDPFPNGSTINGTLLDLNQITTDTLQGSGNYDIGHILTQGSGGGLAGLGVVCTSSKARGGTGRPLPSGDPFDVDYVAHEVGHQMGGSHTFNGTTSNCGGGNRSASNAYEPGSGSTIMAYAGICGAEDLQANSDPYFHVRSLEQIIARRNASGCAVTLATGNAAPVANAGPDRTIPRGTAFYVNGSATDANGDALTYAWEQYDLGAASPPTDPFGPLFRSFNPGSGNFRYMPDLGQVLSGAADPWEIMPSVDRSLTLRLTVRDNAAGGGGVDDDELELTVQGAPFQVTYPNGGESFTGGEPVTVTWNVGGSVGANVKIFLFAGGGFTLLNGNTPNDGSEQVILPCGLTIADGRIWVEEQTGVFEGVHILDVSDANFSLTDGTPDYATYTYSGFADAVVANSTNSGALPVSLTGDTAPTYLRWSFANLGSAYGCDGLLNDLNLDEATLSQWTTPIRPSVAYWLAVGPVAVRGGRHTLWQTMDPENVQAELDETNNMYGRQWVWTPAPIADESSVYREQPPERFAGHDAIPGGVTAYANMDGLFMDEPAGSTWRAAAVGALNGSDYDVYLFTPTSGPEDGFASPLVSSRYGSGATDVVLTNHAWVGPVTYDVGYERFGGDGDYVADVRESGTPLALDNSPSFQSVAADQIIDLGGLTVTANDVGWITLVVEGVTAAQDVQLQLFRPDGGVFNRAASVASTVVDADGRAVLSYDATVAGEYAWLLVRDAVNGLAPFTYTIRALADPADIAMATRVGSHGPVVPRPDATHPTGDPVPAPTLLPGDTFGTTLYFQVANEGPGLAENWELSLLRDGTATETLPGVFSMPGGSSTIYSQAYGGGYYVTGGRHTVGMAYDVNDDYTEIREDNNRFAEQWVFEPAQLEFDAPLTRESPPDPTGGWSDIPVGLTRMQNQDGLRTPSFTNNGIDGFWGGYALAPLGPTDIDLSIHDPSTGAQEGFDDEIAYSARGGSRVEVVFFDMDGPIPAGSAFDAGAVLYDTFAPMSYRAHGTRSLFWSGDPVNQTFGPYTLADGELVGLYEFNTAYGDGSTSKVLTFVANNLSGNADLILSLLVRGSGDRFHVPYQRDGSLTSDMNGDGGNESLSLDLTANQYVGLAVYKKSHTDVGKPAVFSIEILDDAASDVDAPPALAASLEAYPNPFNPQTKLDFALPSAGRATLQIFDAQGKLVRTLVQADLPAGAHTVDWKGRDDAGRAVASGVYLARLVHPDGAESRRMVLMK